eukprot:g6861.t1 g6861   contig23:1368087-1369220(-)
MNRFILSFAPQRRAVVSAAYRGIPSTFFHDALTTRLSSSSSNSPPSKDEHKKMALSTSPHPTDSSSLLHSEYVESTTRGIGQVIFLNSVTSGRIILFSLALGDPSLAAYATLGALSATSTAKFIGLDEQTRKDGLYGYNGMLIGCVASVFGSPLVPYSLLGTIIGASATPIVSASLSRTISMPQWTWSFNIVALTSMMHTRPLLGGEESTDTEVAAACSENATSLTDLALSPLMGMSQIFVVGSTTTGAGILAAIGSYSPKLALHAIGGSAIGCIVGLLMGADVSDVAVGLWGYNSALASMAVGTFFVNSQQTALLSVAGAASSAALFGAMQPVFGMYGVPCLTLPFCTVASACYLLDGQIPGLVLSKVPHSPEKNE